MNNDIKQPKIENIIKKRLSEYLGVEETDIKNEDLLKDDLHMSSGDISDFLLKLKEVDLEIDPSDFTNIHSVSDVIEIALENSEF